ncbi:MAG: hypothetical protein A3G87_00980 [Omnitrophica bacterium RIFCSPLOWO2_12_FULL_50_11]|nr:MAG: hypothetical protein A3G87_00980 [Omnitrophica bacterium RIFCSPLOWO2_12_FULL_50_11]
MLIFILSFIGLWISVYFTGVYYKWFKPDVFWIPRVCQLKEATCMTVLDTPRAKLFGVPNSAFGIILYAYLIADIFVFPSGIALIFLAFAVVRSLYLAYSLLFVTKIPCLLCFTSHVMNVVLFLIVFKLTISS